MNGRGGISNFVNNNYDDFDNEHHIHIYIEDEKNLWLHSDIRYVWLQHGGRLDWLHHFLVSVDLNFTIFW